jgi:hypothetical protein
VPGVIRPAARGEDGRHARHHAARTPPERVPTAGDGSRRQSADLAAAAAKKLVNLYRLVRVGVPPTDLASFAATSDSEPYRAAGLLLAIVVGTPTVATPILQAVRQAAPDADSHRTLRSAASHTGTSSPSAAPPDRDTTGAPLNRHDPTEQGAVDAMCTTCQTWLHLLDGLDQLAADRPGIPTVIRPFQPWAPELARFSFYTRPLWARLTPKEQSQASGQSQHTSESLPD